jgi:hypothetical protein
MRFSNATARGKRALGILWHRGIECDRTALL